jgi:hypothetical protein
MAHRPETRGVPAGPRPAAPASYDLEQALAAAA